MSPSTFPYILAIILGVFMTLLWSHFNRVIQTHELIQPTAERLHRLLTGMAITKHKDGKALAEVMARRDDIASVVNKLETVAESNNISKYRLAAIMNCAIPKHSTYCWVVYQGCLTIKLTHGLIKFDKPNNHIVAMAA